MNSNEILNKYINLIDKGYCSDCNELNCIDNFPHAKITHAIRELQQENKELKQKYENAVADYETTMAEKEQLQKQLKDKTEDYKRMKNNFDSKVDVLTEIDTQQKEFIKYLENEKDRLARECSNIYEDSLGHTRLVNEDKFNEVNDILQKYKSIIGNIDENNMGK